MTSCLNPKSGLGKWTIIALILVLTLAILPLGAGAYYVPTVSMSNTLLPGDFLVLSKLAKFHPDLDQIVAFRSPSDERNIFLKRVVGRPGDRIRLVDKVLHRNGSPVQESWSLHVTTFIDDYRDNFPSTPNVNLSENARQMLATCRQGNEIVVPSGHYFVLGDNRDNSLDSRYLGLIPEQNLVGKPLRIYWSRDDKGATRWARIGQRVQ